MPSCTYCDEPADTLDHVVPLSFSSVRRGGGGGDANGFPRVPCCRECNTLLGNRPLLTVEERRAWLAGALKKRYRKLLGAPKVDLSELGPSLRAMIDGRTSRKTQVERRIAYAAGLTR